MKLSDKRVADLKRRADQNDGLVDFGDIPELDETFFKTACLIEPDHTEEVTLRMKRSVVDAFRRLSSDHTTRMNAILERYAETHGNDT